MYVLKSTAQYSRLIILLSFIVGFMIAIINRYILREVLGFLRIKGYNSKKACILADSKTKQQIIEKLKDNPKLGYKLTESLKESDVAFVKYQSHTQLLDLISSNPNIEFKIIPDIIQTIIEPAKLDEFVDIPLITVKKRSSKKNYLIIKRLIDILLSSILLIITMPLFVLIGFLNIIIYKKIFYIQKRIGNKYREFGMYKFQTMNPGKIPINEVSYLFKAKNDPRITRFGKFFRRSCLDELPQLLNILLGDMSFVGPRPCLKEELHLFKGWKNKKFTVKPGLTGLWQVSGRHELNADKAAILDYYYTNHMSFSLDLKIILKTIPAIIFSRGRW